MEFPEIRTVVVRLSAWTAHFPAPSTDEDSRTDDQPGASMIVGMLGAALGPERARHATLQDLQDRISLATAVLSAGATATDFATAELDPGARTWRTDGRDQRRRSNREAYRGPTVRRRRHLVDVDVLAAFELVPALGKTGANARELALALRAPVRSPAVGRDDFHPTRPPLAAVALHLDPVDALKEAMARENVRSAPARLPASAEARGAADARRIEVHDVRDWRNGVHVGSRVVVETTLESTLPTEDEAR